MVIFGLLIFIFSFHETLTVNCNVTRPCGVGLQVYTNTSSRCRCRPRDNNADMFYHCHENGTIHIQSGRWAYTKNGTIHTIPCPFGYCYCEGKTKYGYCVLLDLKRQCEKNRTGDLCSECEDGLSVLFGSEGCAVCHNSNLWLLLAFIIAMSAAVCMLLYFNFDAFSGYLNAFIYSYQMMVLLIPANIELNRISSSVIYIFSLQGTGNAGGVCLFHGMNNLQKLGVSYLIPGYMFLFTVFMGNFGYEIAVMSIKKLYRYICKKWHHDDLTLSGTDRVSQASPSRKSFGNAFSFVLVVSYSYCTHITLDIMNYTKFNNTYVVHKAAFAEYFGEEHVWYFVLAFLVLLFVVFLFPAVLLFKKTLDRKFPTLHRSEPIFNSLTLCFRENCQGFAAFYFICRLVLLIVNVFCKDQVGRMVFLSMFSMIFLAIFVIVQPYETESYNMWDIIQLGNLCIISNLSLIVQLQFIVKEKIRTRCLVFLNMSVFLPLVIAVFRLASYVYKKKRRNSTNDNDDQSEHDGLYILTDLMAGAVNL